MKRYVKPAIIAKSIVNVTNSLACSTGQRSYCLRA